MGGGPTPNIDGTTTLPRLTRRSRRDPALQGASRLDTSGAPTGRRTLRHRGSLAAWLVLVIGILATLIGSWRWQQYAQAQQHQRLETTTNTVSAALSAYIQRDEDLIEVVRSTVATGLTTTNTSLEQFFTSLGPGRYPGVVGLAYVEVVANSALGSFQQQVTADPPLGQPLVQGFTLTPSGDRSVYCLTRLVAAHRSNIEQSVAQAKSIGSALVPLLNPGFDYCDSAFSSLLRAAATAGSPEVGRIVPLLSRSLPGSVATRAKDSDANHLVEVAVPIYAAGLPTATAAERQNAVVGWSAGLIDPNQATAPILQGVNGLSITLDYRNPTGQLSTIVRAGTSTASELRPTVGLSLPGRWSAVIALPPEAASPTVQALGLLDIGLIVTALLFLLLTRLASSGARALEAAEATSVELRHRSLHDPLTGLPNRDLVFDRADRMLARAKRDLVPLAAFYIDLDNFTAINESLGHTVGDSLLKAIAVRLRATVRGSDTLGRVAGDHFVVLADSISINEGPDPIARKLLAAFAEPFTGMKPGAPLRVTRDHRCRLGPPRQRRRAHPRRRDRGARGEGAGQRPLRLLRARDAHRRPRPARPRARSADGGRAEPVLRRLPAAVPAE